MEVFMWCFTFYLLLLLEWQHVVCLETLSCPFPDYLIQHFIRFPSTI